MKLFRRICGGSYVGVQGVGGVLYIANNTQVEEMLVWLFSRAEIMVSLYNAANYNLSVVAVNPHSPHSPFSSDGST